MESQIRKIKEKYWAGETSIEEEKILKAYFAQQDKKSGEEQFFAHLKMQKELKPEVEFRHPGRQFRLPRWLAAASVIIAIMGTVYIFDTQSKSNEFLVEDPQQALEITRKALQSVSSGMNKGLAYTDKLQKFHEAKEIIKE